jgi:hypothetical protein
VACMCNKSIIILKNEIVSLENLAAHGIILKGTKLDFNFLGRFI